MAAASGVEERYRRIASDGEQEAGLMVLFAPNTQPVGLGLGGADSGEVYGAGRGR